MALDMTVGKNYLYFFQLHSLFVLYENSILFPAIVKYPNMAFKIFHCMWKIEISIEKQRFFHFIHKGQKMKHSSICPVIKIIKEDIIIMSS